MTDELVALALRLGFSQDAVAEAYDSLRRGDGKMAQFSHPELGGMGQWMPDLIMIGDMFNSRLRDQVRNLFVELGAIFEKKPSLLSDDSFPNRCRSWYPAHLGNPSMIASQNNMRYAFFPAAHRLAIEISGHLTIYDTGNHHISRVSQQQNVRSAGIVITSQNGVVALESLPIVAA